MKRFLIILFLALLTLQVPTFADDFSSDGDLWDNFGDQNTYGQTPVTDEEFQKALEKKKKRYNFFGKEIKDKNIPKGEEFRQSDETNFINEVPQEAAIVLVPVEVITPDNQVIPIGHYKMVGERKDGEIYLKLYQAHNLVAKLKATETDNDFNQETVNFGNWIEKNTNEIRFIYGSLDFNAYADVTIQKDLNF